MIFLVPYAYDRMPGGKPREGVPANRLGSKARCDALIEEIPEGLDIGNTANYSFVLTAGFSKESPCTPTSEIHRSVAEEMATYVDRLCVYQVSLFPNNYRFVWGTYGETVEVIRTIRRECANNNQIFVSTNLGHLPRVWLCWFFLKPEGWKVHFVLARHSFTFWPEYFQETAKFFQYLYRFVFKRWEVSRKNDGGGEYHRAFR